MDAISEPAARLFWAYWSALGQELDTTAPRRDACRTREQLDVAWRVQTASPPLSDEAWRAWQRYQQQRMEDLRSPRPIRPSPAPRTAVSPVLVPIAR